MKKNTSRAKKGNFVFNVLYFVVGVGDEYATNPLSFAINIARFMCKGSLTIIASDILLFFNI